MSDRIVIDPLTRIEGHLSVKVDVADGRVTEAWCSGEMFRGFEVLLRGRHPMDAQHITQRICGVCPISHGVASCLAQEMAYGVEPPPNGVLMRNLILGANFVQSHITHFYHLSALDFVDIRAVAEYSGEDPVLQHLRAWYQTQAASNALYPTAPFLPRYEGRYVEDNDLNLVAVRHYAEALDMRALAHTCAALFGGKMPHAATLVPGGVTQKLTPERVATFSGNLERLRQFITESYVPDVISVAQALPECFEAGKGRGNYLVHGAFDTGEGTLFPSGILLEDEPYPFDRSAITEDVTCGWFSAGEGSPEQSVTAPEPGKEGAYSWLKAPRYKGLPMETGPLARLLVAYRAGSPAVVAAIDSVLAKINRPLACLSSVAGRHIARAIECAIVADQCAVWLRALSPDERTLVSVEIPGDATGFGLTEAPRGALGHWLGIASGRISRYQCIVPTTWNCSPRDERGVPGPIEQALVGTPVADSAAPIEAVRVVRSFDPCLACAVH